MNQRASPWLDLYYWKRIIIALVINTVSVLTVITILFVSGHTKETPTEIIKTFSQERVGKTPDGKTLKWPSHHLFTPPKEFFKIPDNNPLESKIISSLANTFKEELVYRFPIVMLAAFFSSLSLWSKKTHRFFFIFILWLSGLILNYHWATVYHNDFHEDLWIPVFTAGISWLWLAIETKKLWPSVVAHISANLFIYILIRLYLYSS